MICCLHRGGLVAKGHHKLIRWAREGAEHILSLIEDNIDNRLIQALYIAGEGEKEKTGLLQQHKASLHLYSHVWYD